MAKQVSNIPKRTEKSLAMMKLILEATDRGELLHWADIAARLDSKFGLTRGCLKNDLTRLVTYGVLVKKTISRKVYFQPTMKAYHLYRGVFVPYT